MRVNGSEQGELNYLVPFSSGALTPKHVKQIGPAWALFLHYEDRVTTGKGTTGYVLGLKEITDEEPTRLGFDVATIGRHRRRLEKHGYIHTKLTRNGYKVTVHKSKKWLQIQAGQGKSAVQQGKSAVQQGKSGRPGAFVPIYDQSLTKQRLSLVAEELAQFWNQDRGCLPEIKTFTNTRKEKLATRLRENPNFISNLNEALAKANASSFIQSGSWKPSIDWFLKNDGNLVKVLEGQYDDKGGANGTPGTSGSNSGAGKRPGPLIPAALRKPIPATPNALTRPRGG